VNADVSSWAPNDSAVTSVVIWNPNQISENRGKGVAPDDCSNCGGSGYVAKPVDLNGKVDGVAFIRSKCPVCGGTGRKLTIPPTTAG